MRAFSCDSCRHPVYFENSVCLTCGAALGWSRAEQRIRVLEPHWSPCRDVALSGCNWIPDAAGEPCFACALTRTRPADDDAVGMRQYHVAEQAKRRLVAELDARGLQIEPRDEATGTGLAFDLLSSVEEPVVTGHADGVVTIDLAEADHAHRENVRVQMGEVYRTMLGHFRHETGHYYQMVLVDDDVLDQARRLFGDETVDYQEAIDRHYEEGPPAGWADHHVSAYATMHPFEDFAETFAHVLHICDGLETARAYGLVAPTSEEQPFADVVVGTWLPLTRSLNQMNRSMGKDDLYPFVLAPPVVEKLAFVHALVRDSAPAPLH